jgi:hypothetical protein
MNFPFPQYRISAKLVPAAARVNGLGDPLDDDVERGLELLGVVVDDVGEDATGAGLPGGAQCFQREPTEQTVPDARS